MYTDISFVLHSQITQPIPGMPWMVCLAVATQDVIIKTLAAWCVFQVFNSAISRALTSSKDSQPPCYMRVYTIFNQSFATDQLRDIQGSSSSWPFTNSLCWFAEMSTARLNNRHHLCTSSLKMGPYISFCKHAVLSVNFPPILSSPIGIGLSVRPWENVCLYSVTELL